MPLTLAIPVYFYPQCDGACLTGDAQRAPQGLPIAEVDRAVHGRGKNKVTRLLICSAAPKGWGEWSGRQWFAYVNPDHITEVR